MQGEILNARYRIIEKLGRGGFGETYLATDEWLDRENRCVVKQLKPNIINKATKRLFEQEAEVLFKLGTHDQIPQLLAHFEQQEKFYLVQEYIEGHDLSDEIEEGKCWSGIEVIKLLKDILKVLEFVHQNNVIHRDIKPGNIMRRKDGEIILIDFGGVKQVTTQTTAATVSTHVVGTPGYMPQEQIYNNAQPCSDIYAVGMLAIEALVGEDPIDIPTDTKTNQPIWRDKADVSHRLADVIDKMVRFSFKERYKSVDEVLDAIYNFSSTASDWYYKGEKLYKLEKYRKAVAAFDKAIEMQPDFYQAWTEKGWALCKLAKYNEALTCCDRAIKIKQDYAKAWKGKARILIHSKMHQQALAVYQQAIDIQPNDYQAWTGKAEALIEIKKYDEALECCDQAIKIKPNYADAWIKRSHALLKLKNYDEALACSNQAIKYEQDTDSAWTTHGIVLNHLEKYNEAIKAFKEATNIKPDNSLALYGWGNALFESNKYRDAIEYYDLAIQYKPDFADAFYQRGMSLLSLESNEEALNCIDKAIELQEDNSLYWRVRATALNKLKRYEESLSAIDKSVEIKPDEYIAWVVRSETLYVLARYQESINSCDRVLKIKPDYELAIQQRQEIKTNLKKLKIKYQIQWISRPLLAFIIAIAVAFIVAYLPFIYGIIACILYNPLKKIIFKVLNFLFPYRSLNRHYSDKK